MSRSTIILIMVIGMLAALSSWLSREKEEEERTADRPQQHIPDYYISGFNAAAFSVDGVPRHRMSAENLTHFADDRSTVLVSPRLAFMGDEGETWQLDAGHGQLDGEGETLLLTKTVSVRRLGEAAGAVELRTSELTVHPDKQVATTRTPVSITGPGTLIEASGLDADFAEERLVLYTVRGSYEP